MNNLREYLIMFDSYKLFLYYFLMEPDGIGISALVAGLQ